MSHSFFAVKYVPLAVTAAAWVRHSAPPRLEIYLFASIFVDFPKTDPSLFPFLGMAAVQNAAFSRDDSEGGSEELW